MKYSYIVDNCVVGYIDYTPRLGNIIYINLLTIYKHFRGNNYSTSMFSEFFSFLKNDDDNRSLKIQLLAMEDMERYGKLYRLYKSWGFKNVGKESVTSDNRGTFRRSLFELTIPNTA